MQRFKRGDGGEEDPPHSREEQFGVGGLDLNASPRGFDLNAPVELEEEDEGTWITPAPQPVVIREDRTILTEADKETLEKAQPSSADVNDSSEDVEPAQNQLVFHYKSILEDPPDSPAALGIDEDLDILWGVWNAWMKQDVDGLDKILESVCEELARNPFSPPRHSYLSLLYVSKRLPSAFRFPKVFQSLLNFLTQHSVPAATKRQCVLPVLACKLLFRAFSAEKEWPFDFVKAYLEDAAGARFWVEHEGCKDFVTNVLTAFSDEIEYSAGCDDMQVDMVQTKDEGGMQSQPGQGDIRNRYPKEAVRKRAEEEYMLSLDQLLAAPSSKENPRPLLRFLLQGICYEDVRLIASSRLEGWLSNPIHLRSAKSLLDEVLKHTCGTSLKEFETVENLLMLSLNSIPIPGQPKSLHGSVHSEIVSKLSHQRNEYALFAIKTFFINEMSCSNPNNVKNILAVLKALPDDKVPEQELAQIVKDLAESEESSPQLLDVVRKLMRQTSLEIDVYQLCHFLLESSSAIDASEVQKSWFRVIIDVTCYLLVYAVNPLAADESFVHVLTSSTSSSLDGISQEKKIQLSSTCFKILKFQERALEWCLDVLAHFMDSQQLNCSMRKLLFLEKEQHFLDASDHVELSAFQFLTCCAQASEEMLARLILMGMSTQFPLSREHALLMIEDVVWRAAAMHNYVPGSLIATNVQFPLAIMQLASNATDMNGEEASSNDLDWRGSLVLLAIAVHNADTVGRSLWKSNQLVRDMMKYLLTGHLWKEDGSHSDIAIQDTLEERGFPIWLIQELDMIDTIYHLGHMLRKCKKPNFFSEILEFQTFPQAWSWIKKILPKEVEMALLLPPSWQGELLYMHQGMCHQGSQKTLVDLQIHLQKLIMEASASTASNVEELIKFLAGKLASRSCMVRSRGRQCLARILLSTPSDAPSSWVSTHNLQAELASQGSGQGLEFELQLNRAVDADDCKWLFSIEKLPFACNVHKVLVPAIMSALQVETSLGVITSYLYFLKAQSPLLSSLAVACSISSFILQRKVLLQGTLNPVKIRPDYIAEPTEKSSEISELMLEMISQALASCLNNEVAEKTDLVRVVSPQWVHGKVASINVMLPRVMVDGTIELLCILGQNLCQGSKRSIFHDELLNFFFPGFLSDEYQMVPGQLGISWFDGASGQEPVVSELQALDLLRSKDVRLARAGLAVLSEHGKLSACMALGLSSEVVVYLFETLGAFPDKSWSSLLMQGKGAVFKRQHFRSSLYLLSSLGNQKQPPIGCLDHIAQSVHPDVGKPSVQDDTSMTGLMSDDGCSNDNKRADDHVHDPWFVTLRKLLVRSCFSRTENRELQAYLLSTDDNGEKNIWSSPLCLLFPVLSFVHCLDKMHFLAPATLAVLVLSSIKSAVTLVAETLCNYSDSEFKLFVHGTLKSIKTVEETLTNQQQGNPSLEGRNISSLLEEVQDHLEHLSSFDKLENDLSNLFTPVINVLWEFYRSGTDRDQSKNTKQVVSKGLTMSVVKLLTKLFYNRSGTPCKPCSVAVNDRSCKDLIRAAGHAGLIFRFLNFLDPESTFIHEGHLLRQWFDLSCSDSQFRAKANVGLQLCNDTWFPDLPLEHAFHMTSWKRLRHSVELVCENYSYFPTGDIQMRHCLGKLTAARLFLEFIMLWFHHPRVTMPWKLNHPFKCAIMENVGGFLHSPLSVRALSNLGIAEIAASHLRNINVVSCKERSFAVEIIIFAASQEAEVLQTVVDDLLRVQCQFSSDMEDDCVEDIRKAITRAVQRLLIGVYLSFPITVKDILQPQVDGDSPILKISDYEKFLQTASIDSTLNHAFKILFKQKDNDRCIIAYGFCHQIATEHPTLMVPHIPKITAHVKELLQFGNELDLQGGSLMVRGLLYSIDILDRLQPYILHLNNNYYSCSPSDSLSERSLFVLPVNFKRVRAGDVSMPAPFSQFELLLSVLIQVLHSLEVHQYQQYSKFIARLADLLCHCVAAGERCRAFVKAHYGDVLEPALQKFGKVKKIGFLLQLLNDSTLPALLITPDAIEDKRMLDEVLKVRSKIMQFLGKPSQAFPTRQNQLLQEDKMQGANLHSVLADLDMASSHFPALLKYVEDCLVDLAYVPDEIVQEHAYVLLGRLLHFCPKPDTAAGVTHSLLNHINSHDLPRSRAAALQSQKFFFYAPGLQECLLTDLFQNGNSVAKHFQDLLHQLLSLGGIDFARPVTEYMNY